MAALGLVTSAGLRLSVWCVMGMLGEGCAICSVCGPACTAALRTCVRGGRERERERERERDGVGVRKMEREGLEKWRGERQKERGREREGKTDRQRERD